MKRERKFIPPPNLLCEKEYWLDPVQSLSGMSLFFVGFFLGCVIF